MRRSPIASSLTAVPGCEMQARLPMQSGKASAVAILKFGSNDALSPNVEAAGFAQLGLTSQTRSVSVGSPSQVESSHSMT